MKSLKQLHQPLPMLLLLVILAACTTQKRRGEMSMLGKLYHNTTAHYNGYFNAEELLEASMEQLSTQHLDNYNQLLDVYKYVAVDNPQAVAGQLDEAIKKVTIVVNLHPYSNWTDDSYLLAGQAQYLKQDYEASEKTLRYLVNNFKPEDDEAKADKNTKSAREDERKAPKTEREKKQNYKERVRTRKQEQKEKARAKREAEQERKRYNRELKKRRKSGGKAPSRPKTQPETEQPAEENKIVEAETPTPAAEETPEENAATPPQGPISLNLEETGEVDIDPESYFLKHRPAYQEGLFWLAKTLIERDNYDGARRLLTQLENDPGTFRDIRALLPAAQAHLAIQEKDFGRAINYLARASDDAPKATDRARYAYIQAQLLQREGQSEAAYAALERVLKNNPPYEMAFSARLSMAQNAYLSGKESPAEATRSLEKMLTDSKNEEFKDQIYYALAEIELRQGHRAEGIAHLKSSLASSLSNGGSQRAESYHRLGNLYFEDEDFVGAKNYFDSTLMFMSNVDPRYRQVELLSQNLTDIAANLQTISLQDSLLRISAMSPADQQKLAQEMRKREEEALRQAAARAAATPAPGGRRGIDMMQAQAAIDRSGGRPAAAAPALQKESSFFAYDDRAVKRGAREFQRRWGDRPLTDNWRRAETQAANYFEDNAVAAEDTPALLSEDEVSQLLSGVPKNDSEREGAHLAIKKAMFDLGRLYRERLENYKQSATVLEDLNQRYPSNLHELDAWYYLYLDYTDLGQSDKAQVYYDKIIERYPTSNYGQILRNPGYAQEYLSQERQLNRQYDATYSLFDQGRYGEAYNQAQQALPQLLGKHPLKPKYALLMAMSVGNMEGKDAYVNELQKVIATYPETPEQTRAKEILRLLGEGGANLPGRAAAETGAFKPSNEETHYIILVFEDTNADLNANKVTISDFNRKYYKLEKLTISNVFLGEDNSVPVLVMRRFGNKTEAMRYYDAVQKNMADFVNPGQVKYQLYAISMGNYREILKARSLNGYEVFFESNYLQ